MTVVVGTLIPTVFMFAIIFSSFKWQKIVVAIFYYSFVAVGLRNAKVIKFEISLCRYFCTGCNRDGLNLKWLFILWWPSQVTLLLILKWIHNGVVIHSFVLRNTCKSNAMLLWRKKIFFGYWCLRSWGCV